MKSIQVVLIPAVLLGAAAITSPRDAARYRQASDAVQAALTDGNYAKELGEFRRLLEVHPNDPRLKAHYYLAMGAAAEKAGEAKDAQLYKGMAHFLDWGIDWRVGKADSPAAIMSAAAQSLAAIRKESDNFSPKAEPKPVYTFPPAPVGSPEYKAPAKPQPMPGYAAASAAGPAPRMSPNSGPPSFPPSTPGQPRPPQSSATPPPPVFQPNPNATPPPGFPMPLPQNQPASTSQNPPPQQSPGPGPSSELRPPMPYVAGTMSGGNSGGPPIVYVKPADPYIMQGAEKSRRRGESLKPMRVVHDHSEFGDKAYFETGCGAMLTVEDGALIFTSSVEAPRSIPASDIVDLHMNVEVGRAVGAFHILTKRGLYLNLAPEAATREQGSQFVAALRKQLGIGE